jgi:outer membrane receptor for ferrienterochelin and colicin
LAAFTGFSAEPPPPAPTAARSPAFSALAEEIRWLQAEKITVSTASLRAESVDQAPATVRVLTQQQMQERGYRNLEDLLKGLPGVDVLNHVNTDSKSVVSIRGVTGNERFIILQDGIRISGPTGGADLQISENYPLYMARQVEFLAGPASALYGADALTGVINIITEEPTREGRVRGSFAGGDFQTSQLSVFAAKRFADSVAITIGGHHQLSDGAPLSRLYPAEFATLPLGATPYSSPVRSFSSFAKVELWEHLTLGWNQSYISTSAAEAELPGTTTLYDQSPVNPTVLATAYARYRREINERLSAEVIANYTRYERLPHSGYHDVFTGFTRAYNYAYGERYHFEPRATFDLERHTLAAGLTADLTYAIPRTVDLAAPYDPSKGPSQQGQTYLGSTIPAQIFDERAFNAGMFLQAQTTWTDRISSTVGLRFDYNSEYGETFNPRVGLVFQQTPETTWKMLYGRSFLAPSAHLRFENYGEVAVPTTAYFFIPNPNLKPEQLQTLELSYSRRITDSTTLGVVGFYTLMSQSILPVFTAGAGNTTFIPGTTITDTEQYQNIGELQSRGIEVTLDHEWKGGVAQINLWGSLTIVNGQLKDRVSATAYDLPFTSQELLKLGATWNYNDRLIVTPSVNFNGPQAGAASPGTTGFGTRTPEFYVVNLYAELRNAAQNVALFLRAENLLDRRYYNAGFGGDYNFYATPQDPRTITVGLRGSF